MTGARQTGKTSLLRRLLPKHGFVSLDLSSEAEQAEHDPTAFLANQWLSILEASGHVRLLEPWFSNRTKSIIKSPKLYICDSGLLCALLNIRSATILQESPLIGAIWESFVFQQLRHRERYGEGGALNFWRDRTREVDFLVDRGGNVELMEAKSIALPTVSDAVNLRFVREIIGANRVKTASVICRTPNQFRLESGITAMPVDALAP